MFVSCFARDRHLYHNVRIATRDAEGLSAMLHVDLDGQILDSRNNVTEELFPNSGRVWF